MITVIPDILREAHEILVVLDRQFNEGKSDVGARRIRIGDQPDFLIFEITPKRTDVLYAIRLDLTVLFPDIVIPATVGGKAPDGIILDLDIHLFSREIGVPEILYAHTFLEVESDLEETVAEDAELIYPKGRVGHIPHHGISAVQHGDPGIHSIGSARCLRADELARASLLGIIGQVHRQVDKDVLDLAPVASDERADLVAIHATDRRTRLDGEGKVLDHGILCGIAEESRVFLSAECGALLHLDIVVTAVKDTVEGMILCTDRTEHVARRGGDIIRETEEDVIVVGITVYL